MRTGRKHTRPLWPADGEGSGRPSTSLRCRAQPRGRVKRCEAGVDTSGLLALPATPFTKTISLVLRLVAASVGTSLVPHPTGVCSYFTSHRLTRPWFTRRSHARWGALSGALFSARQPSYPGQSVRGQALHLLARLASISARSPARTYLGLSAYRAERLKRIGGVSDQAAFAPLLRELLPRRLILHSQIGKLSSHTVTVLLSENRPTD